MRLRCATRAAPAGRALACRGEAPVRRIPRVSGALLAATLLAAPVPVLAADEPAVLALRARALAHEGECERAAALLERPGVPQAAETWLRVGECHLAAGANAAALGALARAVQLDPSRSEAHLLAAMARYHLGDLAEAAEALERARAGGARDARLDLYEGLLALETGDPADAAAAFARARSRDAAAVEPMASYYEGIAHERRRSYEAARGALARVAEGSPESPWSAQAERALTRLSTRGPGRSWLELTAGAEYDDNVVLRGEGVRLPREIANQTDPRLVWAVESGWELLQAPSWSAGALAYYYGSAHDDLDDFDVQAPSFALWHDYELSETASLRTRFDFTYAWVGGDSFVSTNALSSTLHRDWAGAGRTRASASLFQYDYRYPIPDVEGSVNGVCAAVLCGPPGVNEQQDRDRDGNGVAVALEHALPLGVADGELRAGYAFRRYFARGDDYAYQSHALSLGAGARLPLEIGLDVDASYTYRPYRDRSSFPDPDTLRANTEYVLDGASRRDRSLRLDAALERRLGRGTLVARYSALHNDSNTEVFDYNQRIFGLYYTLRIER